MAIWNAGPLGAFPAETIAHPIMMAYISALRMIVVWSGFSNCAFSRSMNGGT
jgi:hypothetical protein